MIAKHSETGFRDIVDGIKIKNLVQGEQSMMMKFSVKKGSTIPPHAHPQEQTGYLLKGKLEFNMAGEITIATEGDSWNIPGGLEHGATALEDCEVLELFSPLREDYLP